ADLVIFDPATVADEATVDHPNAAPKGISDVMVAGVWVVQDAKSTGDHPGQIIRHESAGQSKQVKAFHDCSGCPEMIVIPGGSVTVGSPADEKSRFSDEEPRKEVHVREFAVSKYDVTRGQWTQFVTATRRETVRGCAWTGRADEKADPAGSWRDLGFSQ